MLRRRYIAALVLAICIDLSSGVKNEIDSSIKSIFMPKGLHILVDANSAQGMVFGECMQISDQEYTCTLALEMEKPIDSDDRLKACNITMKEQSETYGYLEKIWAFGKDKAILMWYSRTLETFFSILHFSTCKHYTVKIDVREFPYTGTYVVPGYDTFSIIMRSEEENSCKTGYYCKLMVDDKGRAITDLIPWGNNDISGFVIDIVYSPLKEHLVIDLDRIGYISNDKFQVLNQYGYRVKAVISKTYSLLSVCNRSSSMEIHCIQFDWNGNLKFEISVDVKLLEESSVVIFNLPGGGIFLVHNQCSIDDVYYCEEGYQSCFVVTKVDANGKTVGHRRISCAIQSKYKMNFNELHFYVNENKKYCISHPIKHWNVLHHEPIYADRIDLDRVCFDDENLAESNFPGIIVMHNIEKQTDHTRD